MGVHLVNFYSIFYLDKKEWLKIAFVISALESKS